VARQKQTPEPGRGGSSAPDKREAILEACIAAIASRGVRGLRVNTVAADAGVSTGLLYYHFTDRDGLLAAAFDHVNNRQRVYRSMSDVPGDSPRTRLDRHVVDEFQDRPEVVEMSAAWHELRASAVYEGRLRPALARAARAFSTDIAGEIRAAQASGEVDDAVDADRVALALTIFMDGLDGRWLCDELSTDEVRDLLRFTLEVYLREPQGQHEACAAPTGGESSEGGA
jgi:AcrR family transcriptional regulator